MIYVHHTILEEFIKQTISYMDSYFPTSKFTKMVNLIQAKRVISLLENHGGKIIYGTGELDEKTASINRTIILNPSPSSKLSMNEVFGPILKIYTFSNINDLCNEIIS